MRKEHLSFEIRLWEIEKLLSIGWENVPGPRRRLPISNLEQSQHCASIPQVGLQRDKTRGRHVI